jgi:hypothetical protein
LLLVGVCRFDTEAAMTEWRNQKLRTLLTVIVLLTAVLATGVVIIHGVHRVDPNDVRSMISRNVALGSDPESVLRFLETSQIPHSVYLPKYHRIYAGIDRSTVGLMKSHIRIEFFFDHANKLTSYSVKELYDSL